MVLAWILGSTILISLLSLVGVFTLALEEKLLKKILLILVGFSAGGLMGGALLHLLPEALEISPVTDVFSFFLLGFIAFFIMERVLRWRHCHEGVCDIHAFTYLNLIGDGIHNFIDGVVIAAAFLINIPLGIATTVAVASHELPQEIGDFGVLVYGGFTKARALLFNLISALTAILGALVGFILHSHMGGFAIYLLPFAAGGFIYIAASDLIPELHKEVDMKRSVLSFVFFLLGILLMWLLVGLE
jgi:zinc and cadmium transporter